MAASPIPEDIRRFVLTSVPSVPHLEALLLLRGDPQQAWTSDLLATRLYVSNKVASALLADLCAAGMSVERTDPDGHPAYAYQPGSAHLRETVDQLALLYSRYLLEITHLIHSKLDRKAQQFANAFRLRKDS